MSELQLLFFRGKSPVSQAIKLFTWGEYSHVAVLNKSKGRIIEAWTPGVTNNSLAEHGHRPGTEVDIFDINQYYGPKTWDTFEQEVGKNYDYLGIFGFLTRARSQRDDRWFCSEMVFSVLARNRCLLLNCPAYKVDPTLLSYSPYLKQVDSIVLT